MVAPLRPCYSVWPREADKWEDFSEITYAVIHGPNKQRQLDLDVDVHIINPEGLKWLFDKDHPSRFRQWDILCIDESTKFKDSQTARFKSLKPRLDAFTRRWILTGSFSPNGLMDLFGQVYVLDLGRALGKYITHYRTAYFRTEAWDPYHYIAVEGAVDKIIDRIDPLTLRMKAEDYIRMPEKIIHDILVQLPQEARKTYKEIEDDLITKLEAGFIVAANAAVAGGKCRQVCNGALYINEQHDHVVLHDEKIVALDELIESLQGAPALVMYEFDHDRTRLLRHFGGETPVIGGGTSARRADQYIQEFNAGRLRLLLCHPASMAHGLNLQEACHHIIWFGLTWNLEYYDQSIARIYRQGQTKPVFVYRILVEDSLDQRVAEALNDKDFTQQKLLRALKWNLQRD